RRGVGGTDRMVEGVRCRSRVEELEAICELPAAREVSARTDTEVEKLSGKEITGVYGAVGVGSAGRAAPDAKREAGSGSAAEAGDERSRLTICRAGNS